MQTSTASHLQGLSLRYTDRRKKGVLSLTELITLMALYVPAPASASFRDVLSAAGATLSAKAIIDNNVNNKKAICCIHNHNYEVQTMKLIYRAQTYEYTPRPYLPSSRKPIGLNSTVKDGAVKLIYRGQAFEYTPDPIQPYRIPRAMNWRLQLAKEGKWQPNEPTENKATDFGLYKGL